VLPCAKAAKENQGISEEEERGGRTSPQANENHDGSQDSGTSLAEMGDSQDNGVPPPTPKCHKWLDEIDTDVLRTCPDDNSAVEDAAAEFDTAISQRHAASATRERDTSEAGDKSPSDAGGPTTGVRFAIPDTSRGSSDDDLSGAVELSPVAAGEGSAQKGGGATASEAMLVISSSSGVDVLAGPDGGGERGKRTLSVTGGGTRDKLRRVLRAFAVYNRRVSYCQVRRCAAVVGCCR